MNQGRGRGAGRAAAALRRFLLRGVPAGFVANVGWQSASQVWILGTGFLYALLVGRGLGPAEFGLMALGLGFASVVFQVVELRLHEAVIRYVAEFWEQGDAARTLATVKLSLLADAATGVLALLLVWGLAPWAQAHLVRDPRGLALVILCGTVQFAGNIATATALGLLRVLDRFRLQALISMAGAALKLGATAFALWGLHWRVFGVLAVALGASVATNAVLVGAALSQLDRRVSLRRTRAPLALLGPRFGEMRRFVLNTYLLSLSSLPTKDLDVNLLGWFTSVKEVGVYKIAKSFMAALWAVSDPAFYVVYPELAKRWARREFGALRELARRLTVLLGSAGVVLVAVAFVAVPPVIQWTLGAQYSAAGGIFRAMVWGLLFWAPLLWVNPLLMAAGRPDLVLRASLVGSAAALGASLVLIPVWGGVGAALAYAVANPIIVGLAVWLGRRANLLFPPVETDERMRVT